MKLFLFIAILIIVRPAFGQQIIPLQYEHNFSFNNKTFIKTDSGIIINHYYIVCKNVVTVKEFVRIKLNADPDTPSVAIQKRVRLLTIHGNVSYDFFYRSRLDTPISQQNFSQHTEKVYLNILLKEKYPIKVAFVLRQSNSPYFKNFADINFHFDHFGYYKNLKQSLINKISKSFGTRPDLNALKALTKEKEKQFVQLKGWLASPATLQKIIEERERKYNRRIQQDGHVENALLTPTIPDGDKHLNDNLTVTKEKKHGMAATFTEMYDTKKAEADSLSKQVNVLQHKTDSIENDVQKRLVRIRQKIYKAGSSKELKNIAAANGIETGSTGNFESKLEAIKTLSIGRSTINYTELTAQNITLTGLNVEYNPSYYVAFAAGKVDYRFREYFNKNTKSQGQHLVLGRIGVGDPDKKAVILTVFRGTKNSTAFTLNDTAVNQVNIIGYSIESIFKKDENTGISFEVAKSTKPVTGNPVANKQIGALWKFNDQSNLGVNIKGQALIPGTSTKLSAFYRKTGENFQSFSLFSYRTNQTAWLARADQHFFKQKVNVTGMLRRNDFTNPFTDKTYKTSTIFKSIQLNVRMPKYPSVNIGYYPGTQLYLVNREKIVENAYYLLNGSLAHSYFYKSVGMNSSLVFNRYFNRATDSGFVLYKGSAWLASQTIFFTKFQLLVCYSYNNQPELKYSSLEASGDITLRSFLKIALGAKYNKTNAGKSYWGEKAQVGADLKLLGRLQFQYEKSFLPTTNQTLYPIETGRVSWSKYF